MRGQLTAQFTHDLKTLGLSRNSLTSVSPAWRPPARLSILGLDWNQLDQPLADYLGWIAAAQELDALYLHNNRLHGSIPADLALPPRLRILHLNDNNLTGGCAPSCSGWTAAAGWHCERALCFQGQLLAPAACRLPTGPALTFCRIHRRRSTAPEAAQVSDQPGASRGVAFKVECLGRVAGGRVQSYAA